jgi:hypothetical protein
MEGKLQVVPAVGECRPFVSHEDGKQSDKGLEPNATGPDDRQHGGYEHQC